VHRLRKADYKTRQSKIEKTSSPLRYLYTGRLGTTVAVVGLNLATPPGTAEPEVAGPVLALEALTPPPPAPGIPLTVAIRGNAEEVELELPTRAGREVLDALALATGRTTGTNARVVAVVGFLASACANVGREPVAADLLVAAEAHCPAPLEIGRGRPIANGRLRPAEEVNDPWPANDRRGNPVGPAGPVDIRLFSGLARVSRRSRSSFNRSSRSLVVSLRALEGTCFLGDTFSLLVEARGVGAIVQGAMNGLGVRLVLIKAPGLVSSYDSGRVNARDGRGVARGVAFARLDCDESNLSSG
jgi:hypothetical protein